MSWDLSEKKYCHCCEPMQKTNKEYLKTLKESKDGDIIILFAHIEELENELKQYKVKYD